MCDVSFSPLIPPLFSSFFFAEMDKDNGKDKRRTSPPPWQVQLAAATCLVQLTTADCVFLQETAGEGSLGGNDKDYNDQVDRGEM